MNGETNIPAEVEKPGQIENISINWLTRRELLGLPHKPSSDHGTAEFSRRTILKGLSASLALLTVGGMAAVRRNQQAELMREVAQDACAGTNSATCYAAVAGLDVPGVTSAVPPETLPATSVPLPETLPPETFPPETTPPAPEPEPPDVSAASEQTVAEPEIALPRSMSIVEYLQNAELFISLLPSLDTLHAMYPEEPLYKFVPEQIAHIEMLRQSISLTPEEYAAFSINQTFNQAFGERALINPYLFLVHWAVGHYNDPQDLANKMTPGASVQLYIHQDNIAYQMVPNLNSLTGHALDPLNGIALGTEIYTGEYGTERSCLFGYTPERIKTAIYTAIYALSINGLPINETTLLGHYAADLIFRNPYYDPYTGTFHEIPGAKPISVRKSDPPQEFMRMFVEMAMTFARQLGLQ